MIFERLTERAGICQPASSAPTHSHSRASRGRARSAPRAADRLGQAEQTRRSTGEYCSHALPAPQRRRYPSQDGADVVVTVEQEPGPNARLAIRPDEVNGTSRSP
jgi:hypothetical protein